MSKLNRNLPVPLYYQLYQKIKKKIVGGELKAGDPLPSEFEYCDIYGVSRLTIRKALEELYREGLIVRSRGKGTFVSENKREENLTILKGFTADAVANGQETSSVVIENKLIDPPPETINPFGISEDTPVIFLKRLRFVNGYPMAVESAYFNTSVNPRLLRIIKMDMANQSVYKFFREELKLVLEYADETIEVSHPTEEDREFLKLKPNECSVLRRRFTYTKDNKCLEYVISIYRGDKYKFKVRLGA